MTCSFSKTVDCRGTESTLSVKNNHRGKKPSCVEFKIENSEGVQTTFSIKDKEDVLQLSKFLEMAASWQSGNWKKPDYSVTGYGVKVMSFGKEIARLSSLDVSPGEIESFSYEGFRKMLPTYDSDDYYFILCPRQERGMSKECIDTIIDACAAYQKSVIVSGDISLFKPMGLKDIAKETGYDISTVSRACTGACIYTSYRKYPLSNENDSETSIGLFNQGMDDEISTHAIRDKIRDIIERESKSDPYTDEEIVDCLNKFGFQVARRTVVKYREQLGYPNSRERKMF